MTAKCNLAAFVTGAGRFSLELWIKGDETAINKPIRENNCPVAKRQGAKSGPLRSDSVGDQTWRRKQK